VNRYVVLYPATPIVLLPIDFLFLGLVAKGLFAAQVGDMLGEIRLAPRSCFICLRGGDLIFASGPAPQPRKRRCCTARCSGCFVTRRSN